MAKTRYNLLRLHQGARFFKMEFIAASPNFEPQISGLEAETIYLRGLIPFLKDCALELLKTLGILGFLEPKKHRFKASRSAKRISCSKQQTTSNIKPAGLRMSL